MDTRLLDHVDVERPVGEAQRLGELLLGGGRGRRDRGRLPGAAAGGKQAGSGEERAARGRATQQILAGELGLGHAAATSSVRSTTKAESAANDSSSCSPGACNPAPWT